MMKKKKTDTTAKRETFTEPKRLSLFDILQTNFTIAKRIIFVHRLLYVGEHTFEESSGNNIADVMAKNFKETNSEYCNELLSGILLYYQRYFCCIVEGSEDILNRHLSLLFTQNGDFLKNVKLLVAVHHIKGRFLNDWVSYYGKPAVRVEEIDPESNLENSIRYVKDCAKKMYNFANAYINDLLMSKVKMLEEESEGEASQDEIVNKEEVAIQHKPVFQRDYYLEYLPELKLLNFLVNCKHLKNLKEHYNAVYRNITHEDHFKNKVWPAPRNFIPYDVFDKPYDPITDLPSSGPSRMAIKDDVDEVTENA